MKKIKYPQNGSEEYVKLLDDYKDIFLSDLPHLEAEWSNWKLAHSVDNIPESVENLLVADAHILADVYNRFKTLGIDEIEKDSTTGRKKKSSDYRCLDAIFRYNRKYDKDIAIFFEDKAETLHISACHYCELSYINVYTRSSQTKRQFDLDHYFPKSKCPILALSLFNFVPSCQVCNSRIKLNNLLGDNQIEWKHFNPASEDYNFDKYVKIRLRMNKPVTNFKDKRDYYIHFRCINGYRKPVNFFHLEERYDFHRIEAMRLMSLKAKYPNSAIQKISCLLHKSEADVEEDIFHRRYLKENDRCFAKLTKDIMNFLEVTKAEYVGGHRIHIWFNNHTDKTVDLSSSLEGRIFDPLKDTEYFKRFTIRFNTLEWENGADFAPEYLYSL